MTTKDGVNIEVTAWIPASAPSFLAMNIGPDRIELSATDARRLWAAIGKQLQCLPAYEQDTPQPNPDRTADYAYQNSPCPRGHRADCTCKRCADND